MARSFGVPGDHTGQVSNGYRFPYGQSALIIVRVHPSISPALNP